ncbi:MAG: type II toxin-antitoxin system VapC family toxin [Acidobacteria bacterium]|nr:type II toxin-antitoxin system VapC family toxin [Acidobacteriota bacterium]
MYLLDTNTVSYLVKGRSPAARSRMEQVRDHHTITISSVTEAEIQYGLVKRPSFAFTAAIEEFLTTVQILPWSSQEAAAYATLRLKMEQVGKVLGSMDMLIAAHALSRDAVLVTSDRALHSANHLISVENWATDLHN